MHLIYQYVYGFNNRQRPYPLETMQLPKKEKIYKTTKHPSLFQLFYPTLGGFKIIKVKVYKKIVSMHLWGGKLRLRINSGKVPDNSNILVWGQRT